MGDIAIAAGVALLLFALTGVLSFKWFKKWGIIFGAVVAIVAFLSLFGL